MARGAARREEGKGAEGKKSRRKRRGRAIITTGLTVSRPDADEQSCKKISTPPTPRVEGPEVSYSCVKAPPLQVIRTRPCVSNAQLRISKRSFSLSLSCDSYSSFLSSRRQKTPMTLADRSKSSWSWRLLSRSRGCFSFEWIPVAVSWKVCVSFFPFAVIYGILEVQEDGFVLIVWIDWIEWEIRFRWILYREEMRRTRALCIYACFRRKIRDFSVNIVNGWNGFWIA